MDGVGPAAGVVAAGPRRGVLSQRRNAIGARRRNRHRENFLLRQLARRLSAVTVDFARRRRRQSADEAAAAGGGLAVWRRRRPVRRARTTRATRRQRSSRAPPPRCWRAIRTPTSSIRRSRRRSPTTPARTSTTAAARPTSRRLGGARRGGGERRRGGDPIQRPDERRRRRRRRAARLYLKLCNADWLCASGWHARAPAARFERLPLVGGNATWFALRSVSNGRLVEMVPPEDDEGWVVRARGGSASGDVRARARGSSAWSRAGCATGARARCSTSAGSTRTTASRSAATATRRRGACTRPSPRALRRRGPPPPRNRGGAGGDVRRARRRDARALGKGDGGVAAALRHPAALAARDHRRRRPGVPLPGARRLRRRRPVGRGRRSSRARARSAPRSWPACPSRSASPRTAG